MLTHGFQVFCNGAYWTPRIVPAAAPSLHSALNPFYSTREQAYGNASGKWAPTPRVDRVWPKQRWPGRGLLTAAHRRRLFLDRTGIGDSSRAEPRILRSIFCSYSTNSPSASKGLQTL